MSKMATTLAHMKCTSAPRTQLYPCLESRLQCLSLNKTNEMHNQYTFFRGNILHLHVSVSFDHHQGACVTQYHNVTMCAIVQDNII